MSQSCELPEVVIDMSPKAVTRRLKLASELRDLCLSLAKAKPIRKDDQTTSKP
jgi:hypothetical protein